MDSIDFGRAMKAPFQDKGWAGKTALGFVWVLLSVTVPAVYGAQLEYILRVANGNEELPDWSEFGNKWVKGFLVVLAGLIYFIPVVLVALIIFVPAIITLAASHGNSGVGMLFGGSCLFWVFAIIYALAVSIVFSAATIHFAVKGEFSAFFQFSEIFAHIKDGTGYMAAWLWSVVVGFIVGVAMSVISATGIGAILYPAATYLMTMIIGHIFGQWAAKSYGYPGLGAPIAVGYPSAPSAYPPPSPPAYAPPTAPPAPPTAGYQPAPAAPAYAPPPAPVAPAAPAAPPDGPPVAPAPDAAFAPPADPDTAIGPPAPPGPPAE